MIGYIYIWRRRGGGAYIREEEHMSIRVYRREEYMLAKGV